MNTETKPELNLKKLQNGSDIRGVALDLLPNEPVNLTIEAAALLTKGFAQFLSEKCGKQASELTISIGRDPRLSGESLKDAAVRAMTSLGVRVIDCGLASTPAMFMSTIFPEYNCDGAIMITASHLPQNRNGFKYFTKDGGAEKSDIAKIIEIAEGIAKDEVEAGKHDCACASQAVPGTVSPANLMDTYAESLRSMIKSGINAPEYAGCTAAAPDNTATYNRPLAGLKIVIDAGNGSGGFYAEKVLAPLGADVSGSQFLTPDGSFPNHAPNPENKAALESICKKVSETRADLGLIFDTDVDRSAAVDENGHAVARNGIIALAATLIASENPGSTVVTDSVTSNHLRDFLEGRLGLTQLRFKRGYKNVINKAIELNKSGIVSPLAIETSGHAAFKENYFLDDGAYLATKIVIKLALLAKEGKKISSVTETLEEPKSEAEVRIPILTDNFADYGKSVLDSLTEYVSKNGNALGMSLTEPNYEGVRIDFNKESGDGWCLLRMSLHDPILPLNIESDEDGGAEKIASAMREFLSSFDKLDISKL